MGAGDMGSSADENRKHAWDAVIRELVTNGEVSEDVLHDSDTIIQWWRSLDPAKQKEITSRVEELSQGIFAKVLETKTRLEAPTEVKREQVPKKRKRGYFGCLGLIVAFTVIVVGINLPSSGDKTQQTPSTQTPTETQTITENPRYVYEDGAIHVGADGRPIELINNPDATNPTYAELVAFIKEDTSDSEVYREGVILGRVCADFAENVHNNAEAKGIRAAWVGIDLKGEEIGHACNAFETTDRGLVYVDCTGASMSERFQLALGASPTSRDSIAYVEIGKEYGCIDIHKAKSPSYSFYDEYKRKWYECQNLLYDYNEQVTQYNREIAGKVYYEVYYEGSPELAEIEAWEARMEAWQTRIEEQRRLLDELREELGDFWFEPMGIVEDIQIYWGR